MPLLPAIHSIEQYRASPRDEATYAPAIDAVCERHGIADQPRTKYAGGSTIVFAIGDAYVVKLFEPIFAANFATELEVLRRVEGALDVPTPRVVASGELDGWSYLVMTQLHGRLASDAWPTLSPEGRRAVCEQVGAATARLHALPVDGRELPPAPWPRFLDAQRQQCVEHQRAKGLDEHWLAQIPAFLASVQLPAEGGSLLHTEIMREHVLLGGTDGSPDGLHAPVLTGIFDFEPAMVGHPEYDFASVGVFLTGGDPRLFGAFLHGYGRPPASLRGLPERVMAYALLHRYSNVRWYLETVPPRTARTFGALAQEWFGADRPSPEQRF